MDAPSDTAFALRDNTPDKAMCQLTFQPLPFDNISHGLFPVSVLSEKPVTGALSDITRSYDDERDFPPDTDTLMKMTT